uniref:procollagen-proline 3-dioxygenase n=2 Tax=Denticeps clupeoides TaxID=299321 RepID=A0AAY4BU37_9TELE
MSVCAGLLLLAAAGSCALLEPHDLLFDTAVEAYYKGDWLTVILNMERALKTRSTVRKVRAQCRTACSNQTGFGGSVPGVGPAEDLGFFQELLRRADCVNSCEREKVGAATLHRVSEEVELEFRKRTPYNYLQVAYFKINKLDKAVSAANTFFIANPNHLEMKQNLDYYRMMAGVQDSDFQDLEAQPHMAAFLEGKRLYSAERFVPAAERLEAALEAYFPADQECRALCEGPYDYDGYNYMEYSADLFQAISDHYLHVLKCKQNCVVDLASTAGREKPFEDFLPSIFNYLQFSYYNSENYEKAVECAKTYLLFHPEDEMMGQNLAYYTAVLGEEKAASVPAREGVQQNIRRSLLEKELLYFGYEMFGATFVDPDVWTPAEIMPAKLREKQKVDRETAARITEEIGNLMKEIETLVEEKNKESSDIGKIFRDGDTPPDTVPEGSALFDGVRVTMTSAMLNGSQRLLLDGVVTDDECLELQRLSNAAAKAGDGYRGQTSPHSPNEMFRGVTVLKALKLAQDGSLPLKSAGLLFDLSEKVRTVLQSYFHLTSPLYFSYTHLVCRSAIDEKQAGRDDLSHPVHVDNCVLVSGAGRCVKEPPAYTHRDYSAILYLNQDFEGGEFIFTELDGTTVTATVQPSCGRVVAFSAGEENPHGVRAVTKGQRCAVALWFTLDPRHEEKERIQAQDLLKMLSSPVDAEFLKTEAEMTAGGDAQKAAQDSSAAAEEKGRDKTAEPADKTSDANKKTKSKSKSAATKQTKAAGQAGKAKTKQAEKTKSKPVGKTKSTPSVKKAKPVANKTEKVAVKSDSVPVSGSTAESQKVKDEL